MSCRAKVLVHAENFRGLDAVAEQVADDLLVHRRPGADAGAFRDAVLRRHGRAGDEPVVLRFFDQRIEEELRRAFHRRVEALQKISVAGEEVMFPEILAEPRAAGRPMPPRPVNRRRRAPEVGVVMRHPAARAPVHLRGARAGLGEVHAPSASAARRIRRGCTSPPASSSSRC